MFRISHGITSGDPGEQSERISCNGESVRACAHACACVCVCVHVCARVRLDDLRDFVSEVGCCKAITLALRIYAFLRRSTSCTLLACFYERLCWDSRRRQGAPQQRFLLWQDPSWTCPSTSLFPFWCGVCTYVFFLTCLRVRCVFGACACSVRVRVRVYPCVGNLSGTLA